MKIDRLLQGNPYIYKGEMVLYRGTVKLPNSKIAYSFRTRHGFVNLLEDQVTDLITNV